MLCAVLGFYSSHVRQVAGIAVATCPYADVGLGDCGEVAVRPFIRRIERMVMHRRLGSCLRIFAVHGRKDPRGGPRGSPTHAVTISA